ncbi:hypothetical protein J2Y86_000959 [Pseudomonas migulae]|nr:hypothetical protein [Pseudomonas migulae]
MNGASVELALPEPHPYVRIPPFFDRQKQAWNVFSLCPSIVDTQVTDRVENMNRQKKLQQLFKAKAKKASVKLAPKKPKYISKADRLKLDAEPAQDSTDAVEN